MKHSSWKAAFEEAKTQIALASKPTLMCYGSVGKQSFVEMTARRCNRAPAVGVPPRQRRWSLFLGGPFLFRPQKRAKWHEKPSSTGLKIVSHPECESNMALPCFEMALRCSYLLHLADLQRYSF